ncbi:MAG: hypothetical protein H6Q10_2100 [Acidobacteria bacterium]|nr:hypothetical protein [Acidobacteriota bacterium]
MGWVLTASGALAGQHGMLSRLPLERVPGEQRRLERAEIVDAASGADLRLRARAGGALQASLTWFDLDVLKVAHANGDFHVRIGVPGDVLVLVRTGSRLRVTRNGQTAAVGLDQADEEGLDLAQVVLAGSHAARAFRGVFRHLAEESRASAPGAALDMLDALLGILQGEPGTVDRRAPAGRAESWRASRVTCGAEATCYSEYEAEVIRAWDDYAQCVYDVRWYPGLQEVCAFTWLLRVESAWFRFIGCSSIPLKAT